MKETTLSKITASVAVAKGMAQRALAANPQKGGYPAPSRVTSLTGANRDFPKWRRHSAGPCRKPNRADI